MRKRKLQVIDLKGSPVDPSGIDWDRYNGRNLPYMLRQGPGPDNALGRVKIMFPNSYLVYLHDTPSKGLFEREERSFSSGCIRVDRPLELAQLLLDNPKTWNAGAIESVLKVGTPRTARLSSPVPVLLMYWTIDPIADGETIFKRDPYNRDQKILEALNAQSMGTHWPTLR